MTFKIGEKTCDFCGSKSDPENGIMLLKGLKEVYICFDCAEECAEIAKERKPKTKTTKNKSKKSIMKPSQIKKHLDQYVIGQDKAKEVLAVSVYNHYKRINSETEDLDIEVEKSNILMIGNTGVGKTHLIKTLARTLGVPLAICDSTKFTEAGFVGADVEECIKKLLINADGDIQKAERGIIYLDEIDKLSRKGENPSITKDVGGEGVQQALLTMLEGNIIDVDPKNVRRHPSADTLKIDTRKILFICGGSFEGIETIIKERMQKVEKSIGFGADIKSKKELTYDEVIHEVTIEDLKVYGMIPEMLGRLPIKTTLHKLDKEALINILTEPKNAITKQYVALFSMDNIELKFEKGALEAIAEKALKTNTGARSLRSIMEDTLQPHMFSMPDDQSITKVIITRNCVEKGHAPKIDRKEVV